MNLTEKLKTIASQDSWDRSVRCMGYVEGFDAEVLEALGSDSPDLKDAVLWTLLDNPLEEAGDEALRLATCDQTPRQLRFTAFEVFMSLRPRGSLEALGPLLDCDDRELAEAAGEVFAELASDESIDEEFEPGYFDSEDPMDAYGLYEGECAGTDSKKSENGRGGGKRKQRGRRRGRRQAS